MKHYQSLSKISQKSKQSIGTINETIKRNCKLIGYIKKNRDQK